MNQQLLTYLQRSFTEPIRDTLWNNIYFTPALLELVSCERVQQLSRIRQLGPTFHLYPGAVHTRLNHSIGVYRTAKKMITSLLVLSPDAANRVPFSMEGIKSFLAAALLHDLGHFPFTHSFKELPLKDHEVLSGEIILEDSCIGTKLKDFGADVEMTAAIIDTAIKLPYQKEELSFYRRLLSGVLDPDKLDYLNRDAQFCGVPYGLQDVDFIIDRLRITGEGKTGMLMSGIGAIEHLLFSKYLMYRHVYWHRTVRSATAMIKKSVSLALQSGELTPDSLYDLDDESFNHLWLDCRKHETSCSSSLELIGKVMHRDLHSCALEILFDPSNPVHLEMENLSRRSEIEHELERQCRAENQFIIDIPEKISFEVDIPLLNGADMPVAFSNSGTVFSSSVVEGFAGSLRKIRLFVPSEFREYAGPLLTEFMGKGEKYG